MKYNLNILCLVLLPAILSAQAKQAILLGHWDDPTIPGSADYNNRYNEVWSVAVKGREYAIIGSTMGTHFIDVTNPSQPFQADFIPGAAQGPAIVHRDFKTYKHYIYGVCDEGNSTLQIMDVSTLPDSVRLAYNSSDILIRTHNISIDSSSALLYAWVFGGSNASGGFGGMAVISLEDPENPVFLKKFGNVEAFQFGHIHDGYVRHDTAFLDAGYNGLGVADFSDPLNPKLLGTMTGYAGAGYNHSGWLSDNSQYYFLADETHGSPVKTVDVRDLEDMKVVDSYNAESTPTQIPHNPLVACNYLYVAYYYDGLQVYDISDPVDVKRVLYYDTSTEPDGNSYKGAWGVNPFLPSGNILLADMQNGLFIFEGVGDHCNSPVSGTKPEPAATGMLQVFPQPAVGSIQVRLPESLPKGSVLMTVSNSLGQQVLQQRLTQEETTVILPAQLPSGMYQLSVETTRGRLTQKVVIGR